MYLLSLIKYTKDVCQKCIAFVFCILWYHVREFLNICWPFLRGIQQWPVDSSRKRTAPSAIYFRKYSVVIFIPAIGCPDPTPPTHGTMKRTGVRATMSCPAPDDVTWEITCRDGKWHGYYANCSAGMYQSWRHISRYHSHYRKVSNIRRTKSHNLNDSKIR